MAERWALVVGVESPLHPAVGAVPFAEADARAVADALGVPESRRFLLLGKYATMGAIESRLRRLRKLVKKDDELVVFWAGVGHSADSRTHLAAWDTLPDDLADTAIDFESTFGTLTQSKAARVAFLLSLTPGEEPPDADELRTLFESSPKAVGLLAARADEEPRSAAGAKGGLWSLIVAEALAGQARRPLDKQGRLTAGALQKHVEDELPRRLRKHFEGKVTQTPLLFGDADAVLATFDAVPEESVLDAGRLRRVVFRSESSVRVKDLTEFRKTFQLPDAATPSARKFIARIATADVRADLERVFDRAREHLGYKRKDIELKAEQDGTGFVRTPDFGYSVYADLDPDEPTKLIWRREVGQFADPGFVRSAGFAAVFGAEFDRLVFEFAKPLDVADFIDRLEDDPPAGAKVAADADGKSCEVKLPGFAGAVRVQRHALVVRGRAGDAGGLLDQLLKFFNAFGTPGEARAIGPA